MSTLLFLEVAINALNKALVDKDDMRAKQILCEMEEFSESKCKETEKSSTVANVVASLIKEKMDNPSRTITNSQIDNAKQGNPVFYFIILKPISKEKS